MRQAESFCDGNDRSANAYDDVIAIHARDVACLDGISDFLYRLRWSEGAATLTAEAAS